MKVRRNYFYLQKQSSRTTSSLQKATFLLKKFKDRTFFLRKFKTFIFVLLNYTLKIFELKNKRNTNSNYFKTKYLFIFKKKSCQNNLAYIQKETKRIFFGQQIQKDTQQKSIRNFKLNYYTIINNNVVGIVGNLQSFSIMTSLKHHKVSDDVTNKKWAKVKISTVK